MERASVWLHGIEKVYHKDDFDVKISAEEFDLKNDYKFQLVCSSCNSPATFVKHKDGRKYFRHPKRTSKELFEKDKSCAQRSDSVNPSRIRKFNTIIEQTTLGEITCNFYQMIGNLFEYDYGTLQRVVNDSKRKSVKKLLDRIENFANSESETILAKVDEKQLFEAKERLKLNREERFERYKNSLKESLDGELPASLRKIRADNFTFDYLLDNKNLLFHELAEYYINYEINPGFIGESYRDIYPLILNQQLDIFPRLFGMIMHQNSWEMRYFVVFNELCWQYEANLKDQYDDAYWEKKKDSDFDKLKHYLANIIVLEVLAQEINNKELQELVGPISKEEVSTKLKYSVDVFNRQMSIISPLKIIGSIVTDFLKHFPVNSFYLALDKAKRDMAKTIEGFGGWIYLATNNSLTKRGINNEIKIGKTKNIPKRLAQYQFASSDGFIYEKHWRVKDRHKAEKFIHKALSSYKFDNASGGKEWFKLSSEEGIQKVDELIEKFEEKYGFFEKVPESKKGFG